MSPKRAAIFSVVVAALVGAAASRPSAAPEQPNLAGRWTLNRSLSQIPAEVGFGMDLLGPAAGAAGREDAPNNPAMAMFRESADDAARREHLVDEVRNPPEELAITQTEEAVIISGDGRKPRTFRPDGKDAIQTLGVVSAPAAARWNGPRFEIRYKVEQNRELRYEFIRTTEPDRLTVEIRFIERGGKDVVTLVYEPARADAPAPPKAPSTVARTPPPGAPPAAGGAAPPTLGGLGQPPTLPRQGAPTQAPPPKLAPPAVALGPDAALAGLKRVGVVVEELRPQAAACGLTQAPLEAIVTKAFTDAGIKVVKDSDEDTYVYVDIGTTNLSPTLCVSRYDVYLFSNTTATLSYQSSPALVQVQLLHEGGLAGGAPVPHGESVRANVKRAVDEFVSRIRAVSK